MRRLLLPFTLVALLAAACGDDSEPVATNDLDGAGLYATNCASCHGADLRGTNQGPSHLSIVYEPDHHGDEAFRAAIHNGAAQHHWDFGDMPPVEGLTADEVDAIIAFIRAEQQEQGFQQ